MFGGGGKPSGRKGRGREKVKASPGFLFELGTKEEKRLHCLLLFRDEGKKEDCLFLKNVYNKAYTHILYEVRQMTLRCPRRYILRFP